MRNGTTDNIICGVSTVFTALLLVGRWPLQNRFARREPFGSGQENFVVHECTDSASVVLFRTLEVKLRVRR